MRTFKKNSSDKKSIIPLQLISILVLFFLLSQGYFTYGNYRAGSAPLDIVISSLLLSIPLILLYFSIGILITAARQRRNQGWIGKRLATYIYWTPRISGILIVLFVSLFSLDVFSAGGNIWDMLGGFVIHSIPSIVMGLVLILAWKRDWIGFIVFLGAAIFFMRALMGNPFEQLGIVLLFSGPMAVIAFLFWANWKWIKPQKNT